MSDMTLGVLFGNRDFFPDQLVSEARRDILDLLEKRHITSVLLSEKQTKLGGDPDKCILFHCGNWARSIVPDNKISTAPILGTSLGEENTAGAMQGCAVAGPLTFVRLSTDDQRGVLKAYVGMGELTDDELQTFGNRAVAHVENLEKLMHHICRNGFEHHVAFNVSHTADALYEAFSNYLDWDVHYHNSSR